MASDVLQGPDTAVGLSRAMIELALDDVARTYRNLGGGGISEVTALKRLVYRVSMPQEERVDRITYTFELDAQGRPRIVDRKEDAEQP